MIPLHLAIILFGLAGIAGKMVSVPSTAVVFYRTVVATLALACVWRMTSGRQRIGGATLFRLLPSGALLGLHWLTFFLSVRISTVAIGLLSFATFPVFVAFLGPLLSRRRMSARDVFMALVVFFGLALVVPTYSYQDHMFQGVLWGLLSAVAFALVTCINRRVVGNTDPLVVGMLQNLWAALVFLPLSGGVSSITGMDLALIGFLGIGCSAIGHTLFVAALRTVRAELAALTSALEPLYGIVFAYLILGEVPNVRTTLGGLLIIVAVTFASMVESLEKSPEEKNPQLSSRVEPTVSTARLS